MKSWSSLEFPHGDYIGMEILLYRSLAHVLSVHVPAFLFLCRVCRASWVVPPCDVQTYALIADEVVPEGIEAPSALGVVPLNFTSIQNVFSCYLDKFSIASHEIHLCLKYWLSSVCSVL